MRETIRIMWLFAMLTLPLWMCGIAGIYSLTKEGAKKMLEIKVSIKNGAFDNKPAIEEATQEFYKQAVMAKMTANYRKYEKADAFCANVLLIEDMKNDGFLTDALESELGKINRRLNMDWIDDV